MSSYFYGTVWSDKFEIKPVAVNYGDRNTKMGRSIFLAILNFLSCFLLAFFISNIV